LGIGEVAEERTNKKQGRRVTKESKMEVAGLGGGMEIRAVACR